MSAAMNLSPASPSVAPVTKRALKHLAAAIPACQLAAVVDLTRGDVTSSQGEDALEAAGYPVSRIGLLLAAPEVVEILAGEGVHERTDAGLLLDEVVTISADGDLVSVHRLRGTEDLVFVSICARPLNIGMTLTKARIAQRQLEEML